MNRYLSAVMGCFFFNVFDRHIFGVVAGRKYLLISICLTGDRAKMSV